MFQACYNIYIERDTNIANQHCGRGAFIMKLNKKVLNGSLVVLLALGLGGCAANSATSTHKTHEASSEQVVKQSSHKKANKTSAKTDVKYAAEKNSTSANSTSLIVTSNSQVAVSSSMTTANHNGQVATNNTAASTVAPAKTAETPATNVKQNQPIQLGLGDVATWTDAKGVTHHVDSDGMDRYTTKGSSQVQYQDWSGQLPNNAVVSHH